MVTAKHKRKITRFRRMIDFSCKSPASLCNRLKIFCTRITGAFVFLRIYGNRSHIAVDCMTKAFNFFANSGKADCRRSHIRTVTACPEIKRHFKNTNVHTCILRLFFTRCKHHSVRTFAIHRFYSGQRQVRTAQNHPCTGHPARFL